MVGSRTAYIVALGMAIVLAVIAAWVIARSPAQIDDIGAYQPPASSDASAVAITVSEGQSPANIGEDLKDARVIGSSTQFEVLVSLLGFDRLLQAGEYEFQPNSSALDVVYRIRNGETSTKTLVVIEGTRREEVAESLDELGISGEEFLRLTSNSNYNYEFLQDVPVDQSLEGYLYPATYTLRTSDTPQDIVTKMLDAFDENVPVGLAEQAASQGLTLTEVVALASIIQREAVLPEEKPIMAQVFLSRLEQGIRLDADPTVQFAIAEDPESVAKYGWWKQGLTLDDLAIDSLYNTYLVFGLPPGPISNPAVDTIEAVVNPSDTNYLYFVAKGDGSHAFAETLEEHNANVEEYLGLE